jgi:hypothetical protein
LNFDKKVFRKFTLIFSLSFFFFKTELKSQYLLNFCNNNKTTIDSIEISFNDTIKIKKSIPQGNCFAVKIPNEWSLRHGIVLCNYKIYFGYNYINAQKLKSKLYDTIFISEKIQQEPDIEIFLNNVSNNKIDTITAANYTVTNSKRITPRNEVFLIKYNDLNSKPEIEISINKIKKKVTLNRQDFGNLDNPSVQLWLNDSLFLKGTPSYESIKEYNISFMPETWELKFETIKVVSSSLIGENEYPNEFFKTFVFDFEKLRKKPFFTVFIGTKKYNVKLSAKDLSSIYNGQRYFWISDKRIKREN